MSRPRRPPALPRLRPGHLDAAALGAVLVVALALRAVGAGYGLPLPLLNPDEANIVPRAWAIVHGGGPDPGWFDYPSLLLYLQAPFQAVFAEPSYGAARVVAVLIGLAGVVAAHALGRAAYGRRAGLAAATVVAVATTHVAYSRMAVTDVLLTTLVTVALVFALRGRLELAGVAVGLAASAKYPGALAAIPVAVAAVPHWRRLARAGLLAAAGFAATSPFVLVRAGDALEDIRRVQRLARAGWLGFEHDPVAPLAYLDRLWQATGPVTGVALAGLAVALLRRSRRDLVLASFVAAYWLYLLPQAAHFDRYVLPLVPVLAVLAVGTRPLALLTVAALAVPLAWSVADAARLTRTDTRLPARAWVAAHLGPSELVAADPSTLPLEGRRVVRLALPGPGFPPDTRRTPTRLRALGVTAVLVGGKVTDRVRAAAERYPLETRFYDELERLPVLYAIDPGRGLAGPWLRLYRLQPPPG